MELSSMIKLGTERQLDCHNREQINRHSQPLVDLRNRLKFYWH